jgi:hypothetical protein
MDCHAIWTQQCSTHIPMSSEYGFSRLSWDLYEVVCSLTTSTCLLIKSHIMINFGCVLTSAKRNDISLDLVL